jgi:hypothetical protein
MASKYLQKFPIPPGFPKVLHDLSREILREQPRDIIAFAAKYFRCKADGEEFDWDDDNPRAPKPVDYPRIKNAMRSPVSSSSDKERHVKMKASRPNAEATITANAELREEVRRANEEAAAHTDSGQAPESERISPGSSVHATESEHMLHEVSHMSAHEESKESHKSAHHEVPQKTHKSDQKAEHESHKSDHHEAGHESHKSAHHQDDSQGVQKSGHHEESADRKVETDQNEAKIYIDNLVDRVVAKVETTSPDPV